MHESQNSIVAAILLQNIPVVFKYVTNSSILQQSKHDCGSPGNETMSLILRLISSLIPRLPWTGMVKVGGAWFLFSCEHDVIGKRPEQKARFCTLFNQL